MTNLPGLSGTGSIPDFINSAYLLIIAIASMWAIVKISIAGIKWTLSDVVTHKSDAISDIKGVIAGLLLLLSPALILNTINPSLLNLNILGNLTFLNSKTQVSQDQNFSFGQNCGVSASVCGTSCPGKYVRDYDGGGFVCIDTSIVNTGEEITKTEDNKRHCTDGGGFIQTTGLSLEGGAFKCISKPKNPGSCSNTDTTCLEICTLSGGVPSNQGGYSSCISEDTLN